MNRHGEIVTLKLSVYSARLLREDVCSSLIATPAVALGCFVPRTDIAHSSELIIGTLINPIENFQNIQYIGIEGFPLKPLKDNYHGS